MNQIKLILILLFIFQSFTLAKENLEKVSLQLHWKYQFEFAGFIAAKEKGFYKDVGLDVELKEYSYGLDIENEVMSQKSNYGVYNSNILLSYLKYKEIKLLASFFKRPALIIITKPNIKTVNDLVGKTIMSATKEDFDFNFKYIFDSENINTKSLNFTPHTYNIQDFIDGKCDAMTAFISDQPYQLDKKNIKYNIINPTDYGIYNLQLELFSSLNEVENNPQRTELFKKASIKGWKYALENEDEIIDMIIKKYNSKLTYEFLKNEAKKTKQLILPNIYKVGSIDRSFMNRQSELFKKEYNLNNKQNIDDFYHVFTDSYVNKKQELKVCINPNWTPIEFIKDRKPQGISIDTLEIIGKDIGLKLKYIETISWSQSQQFLKDKKCDILPSAIKTDKRLEYANFTKPYLKYALAIITTNDKPLVANIDALKSKTMARKKSSGLIPKMKKRYPNIRIIENHNYGESFKMVSNGTVDFTISTLPVFAYNKNKYNLNNLHIAGGSHIKYNLSIAVRKDDTILLNLLNKSLEKIDSKTHNIIYEKWTKNQVEFITDYTVVFYISLLAFIIISIISYLLLKQKRLQRNLSELNKTLESRIKIEVNKNREKDSAMFHQSRLAQMGEMLAMIAHQWRQPLSAISSTNSAINLKAQLGTLDNDTAIIFTNKITQYTQYLSSTIDDFRKFFKSDKEKSDTTYNKLVADTLQIIEVSISNHDIKLIVNTNSDKIVTTYDNEIKQVLLNLIKNAEDVLIDRKIDNPIIVVESIDNQITVSDNAGGVPIDIIDKIFEPYFSTKLKKDGTGLGLYMSKTIIEEHCEGKLTVSNNKDGAVFKIILEDN